MRLDWRSISRFRALSAALGLLAVAIGAAVVTGWYTNNPAFTSAAFNGIGVKMNTAVGLMAGGIALLLLRREGARLWRRALGYGVAALPLLIGAATLAEYALERDLHIDQLLFKEPASLAPKVTATPSRIFASPGRMGIPAAVGLVVIGVAMLLIDARSKALRLASPLLALLICLGCFLPLLDYAYNEGILFGKSPATCIALYTTIALAALGLGTLVARPERPPVSLACADDAGGLLVRVLLAPAVVLPFLMGLILVMAHRYGAVRDVFEAVSLLVTAFTVTFAALIWRNAETVGGVSRRRELAELAHREAEQRLRIAMETAKLGAWQLDVETGSFECSAQCRANFGLKPEDELSYERLNSMIFAEDVPQMQEALRRALENKTVYEAEYRVRWPDGSTHWILASGRGYYDVNHPYRMVGVTLDVTARKMIEQQRATLLQSERHARAEAERANRAKDEFLATLSHELRTPLTAILGWSQFISSVKPSEEDLRQGLGTIERNARAQARLIDDLLDVSRIVNGKLRLNVQEVDLISGIESAIESARPAAMARGVHLQKALDPQAGAVLGDPARLQQVAWNLLTNAIKFTPRDGLVQVVLERVGSEVEMTVSDTGIGIRPELIPHVFDRFRQGDSTTARRHGGLGLGLAIVRHLVEMHGGTVRVESEGEGKGTTFTVSLPLSIQREHGLAETPWADRPASDATAPVGAADSANGGGGSSEGAVAIPMAASSSIQANAIAGGSEPRSLHGVKVLIVDDEPDARVLIRRLLREEDAEVLDASSAAEAIDLLRRHHPQVLVSDIGMPDADGYELIRQVRSMEGELGKVNAVAVTAFARAEDRRRALSSGYQMHVAKPLEPSALTDAVATLAGRS